MKKPEAIRIPGTGMSFSRGQYSSIERGQQLQQQQQAAPVPPAPLAPQPPQQLIVPPPAVSGTPSTPHDIHDPNMLFLLGGNQQLNLNDNSNNNNDSLKRILNGNASSVPEYHPKIKGQSKRGKQPTNMYIRTNSDSNQQIIHSQQQSSQPLPPPPLAPLTTTSHAPMHLMQQQQQQQVSMVGHGHHQQQQGGYVQPTAVNTNMEQEKKEEGSLFQDIIVKFTLYFFFIFCFPFFIFCFYFYFFFFLKGERML